MDTVRILIDTDLGDDVDDAAALMLALSCKEVEIAGVTTVFRDTKKRAWMVKDLLGLYGRDDIPVYAGYGDPIMGKRKGSWEEPVQYGLIKGVSVKPEMPEAHMHADDFIIHMVKEDGNLVILAMGAMTNLAMAFLKEPELMRNIPIIGMGGAFMNSSPEWNILCDPEAASIVMEQSRELILMGLDVTKFLIIDRERLDSWKARKDRRMDYFLKGVEMFREASRYPVTFHDVLLVAYLIDSQVASLKKGNFAVELSGKHTRGTMVDMSSYYEINPRVESDFRFAYSVDLERFYRILDEYF